MRNYALMGALPQLPKDFPGGGISREKRESLLPWNWSPPSPNFAKDAVSSKGKIEITTPSKLVKERRPKLATRAPKSVVLEKPIVQTHIPEDLFSGLRIASIVCRPIFQHLSPPLFSFLVENVCVDVHLVEQIPT